MAPVSAFILTCVVRGAAELSYAARREVAGLKRGSTAHDQMIKSKPLLQRRASVTIA